jgi:hypothetical protein
LRTGPVSILRGTGSREGFSELALIGTTCAQQSASGGNNASKSIIGEMTMRWLLSLLRAIFRPSFEEDVFESGHPGVPKIDQLNVPGAKQ